MVDRQKRELAAILVRKFRDGEITQRLGRLLIAGLVCGVAEWGVQFLPAAYQPSRPLYALAWLAVSAGAYIILRRTDRYLGSVAGLLSIIFAGVFLVSLLVRN
jgi:hypothetical protein